MQDHTDALTPYPAVAIRHKQKQKKKGKSSIRLPLPVATTLWMRDTYVCSSHEASGQLVVLSYALSRVDQKFPLMICIHPEQKTNAKEHQQPPWPSEWNPLPTPTWQTIHLGKWVGLPDTTASCEGIVQAYVMAREAEIESGMQNRCAEISKHGDNLEFLESLDYYTTLRVKHAYLCMNTESIEQRLVEVHKKLEEVCRHIQTTPLEISEAWQMPVLDEAQQTCVNVLEDPNALCAPQIDDYAIPSRVP